MTKGSPSREAQIEVYLGLGSNMGDREANLRQAVERIETLGLMIVAASSIYETEPVGMTEQPWFLNKVIRTCVIRDVTLRGWPLEGSTDVKVPNRAQALLSALLDIEQAMGRKRSLINGPRLIDIDLLMFGEEVITGLPNDKEPLATEGADIIVPHPRMHERRFVLEPLCEIAPDLVHPLLGLTCRELLARIDGGPEVRPYQR